MCRSEQKKSGLPNLTPMGCGTGVEGSSVFFLQRKFMFPNLNPYRGIGVGMGVQFHGNIFARNCMKCLDLYRSDGVVFNYKKNKLLDRNRMKFQDLHRKYLSKPTPMGQGRESVPPKIIF